MTLMNRTLIWLHTSYTDKQRQCFHHVPLLCTPIVCVNSATREKSLMKLDQFSGMPRIIAIRILLVRYSHTRDYVSYTSHFPSSVDEDSCFWDF